MEKFDFKKNIHFRWLIVTKIIGMYNKSNTMCVYIKKNIIKNDLMVYKENTQSTQAIYSKE